MGTNLGSLVKPVRKIMDLTAFQGRLLTVDARKDAREKGRDRLSKYKEVKLGELIYVYTEGKEVWMILIKKENKIVSRVFATNRFIWEETQPPSPFHLK